MSFQGKHGAGPSKGDENPTQRDHRWQILILKTMLQYHYENGVFPSDDSAELFEKVKHNGIKVEFSKGDMQTMISKAKFMYTTDVLLHGGIAIFKNHLLKQRFQLSKKIWGRQDDDEDARQECVYIDSSDNRPVIKSTKKKAGYDHQDNQESWDENDVELHSVTCRNYDMMNIAILKCILAFKRTRGVLPPADSDQLYIMVKSTIRHSGLTRRYLEFNIKELEASFWENVGNKELLTELCLIPLHREIFELSRRVWGGKRGATADEKESAKTKEN